MSKERSLNNIALDKEIEQINSKQDNLSERLQEVAKKLVKVIPSKVSIKHKRNKQTLDELPR